jgi:uncharacterized protein
MKVRRIALDVDIASESPTLFEIAETIHRVPGVHATNITINEIDMETVGTIIIIEGDDLDYKKIIAAIESAGAAVHSVDEVATGERTLYV